MSLVADYGSSDDEAGGPASAAGAAASAPTKAMVLDPHETAPAVTFQVWLLTCSMTSPLPLISSLPSFWSLPYLLAASRWSLWIA